MKAEEQRADYTGIPDPEENVGWVRPRAVTHQTEAVRMASLGEVKGASGERILTDRVSLVRFATHQDNELISFPQRVNANFKTWHATQQSSPPLPPGEGGGKGKRFTEEQYRWLEMIRDHIAANLSIEADDFEYAPFSQQGGLGKVRQLFGDKLSNLIKQLNESLVA